MRLLNPYDPDAMAEPLWVLRRWQTFGYKSAIIGGGAVRDLYFRKRFRDIDIFYNVEDDPTPMDLINAEIIKETYKDASMLFSDLFELDLASIAAYDAFYGRIYSRQSCYLNRHIVDIINVMKNEITYQFIGIDMNPIEYAHKHFDTGICRCFCTGTKYRYTNEFMHDAINETITIDGDISKKEYDYIIRVHIRKLQRKFPTFKIIDTLRYKYGKKK